MTETQGARVLREARERVAARVAASGGLDAYRAQAAEQQLRADATRRAQEATAAVEAAERALERARLAAQHAADTAAGLWTVTLGPASRRGEHGYLGGYSSPADAARAAEHSRHSGRGAAIRRPYCGHGWDDRLTKADGPCLQCAKAQR